MKQTLLLLISPLILLACEPQQSVDIGTVNPEKYFSLKYDTFEYQGQTITDVQIVASNFQDSIGRFMQDHKVRFDYLLMNKIDNFTLDTLYPDTTRVRAFYLKSLAQVGFRESFNKLVLSDVFQKEEFSVGEMMQAASKFFLVEKSSLNEDIGTRICITKNGTEETTTEKDFTIIEACNFEFILDRSYEENGEEPFMQNLDRYINEEREKLNEISDLAIIESKMRHIIFKKMENDEDLKKALLEHYEQNKENLPFTIVNL